MCSVRLYQISPQGPLASSGVSMDNKNGRQCGGHLHFQVVWLLTLIVLKDRVWRQSCSTTVFSILGADTLQGTALSSTYASTMRLLSVYFKHVWRASLE
jgi:hypothetical protein